MADLLSFVATPLAVMLLAVLAASFEALSWAMRGPLETPQTPAGIVSFGCAALKFTLLVAGIVGVLVVLGYVGARRLYVIE